MSLTPEQELEMYADIKVIKNNCVRCFECQKDHEKRIKKLEHVYWEFLGACIIISFLISISVSNLKEMFN